MKKKNGFTLIELLVTIFLIITIIGIAIVSFIKISDKQKKNAYEKVKEQIMDAAEDYFSSNEYLFEGLSDNSYGVITLGTLVEEDYINKATDPRNKKGINPCTQVRVTKKDGVYSSSFKEFSEGDKCDNSYKITVSEPGAPEIVMIASGKKGNDPWYVENVTLNVEINTKNNGVIKSIEKCIGDVCTNYNDPLEIKNKYIDTIKDTASTTIKYKATNMSGKTAEASVTLKVDTNPPTCSYKTNKEPSNTGWYNNNTGKPTLTITGTDSLSGIDGKSSATPSIGVGNNAYSYTFKDKAGNLKECSTKIKYDDSSPLCPSKWSIKDVNVSNYKNCNTSYSRNNWHCADVKLTINKSSDWDKWSWDNKSYSTSGLSSDKKTISNTYNTEMDVKSIKFYVKDKAGNVSVCDSVKFGIDHTQPKLVTSAGGWVDCHRKDSNYYNSWGYSVKFKDDRSGVIANLTEYYSSWDCNKTNPYHWASSSSNSSYKKSNDERIYTVFAGCSDNPDPKARFNIVDGAGNVLSNIEIIASKKTGTSKKGDTCNSSKWFTDNR